MTDLKRYCLSHWLQLKRHSRLEWMPGTWCDCGALSRDARHLKAGYWNGLFKQTLDNHYLQQLNLTGYHRKKALLTHISQQYTSVSAEPKLDLLFRCSEAQTRPGNTENSTFGWRFEHRLMHYHIVGLMGVTGFILSANIVRKLLESLYNRGILSQFLVNSIVKS